MKEDHLTWELVREKKLVDNEWIDFRESEWRFPDGLELGPFYTYHRKDYAVIAALDEAGRFLCVRQFRQGIRHVTTEFPAGGLEEGEDPLTAAQRELREETGYVSDDWTFLAKLPSDATISDNYAYLYLARNCRREAPTNLDVTEFVDAQTLSGRELEEMIRSGSFEQAVHAAGYYMARDQLRACTEQAAPDISGKK